MKSVSHLSSNTYEFKCFCIKGVFVGRKYLTSTQIYLLLNSTEDT